jgi:tetratricopeptide (TPR) repeat protein
MEQIKGKKRLNQNMNQQNLAQTHPNTPGGTSENPPPAPKSRRKWIWIGALVYLLVLGFVITASALAGNQSGEYTYRSVETQVVQSSLDEQFALAMQDMAAERYAVAIQRFEYIINQDPTYPGITEQMALAMQVLYATATPTPPQATITPTPTRDLRPVEELMTQALSLTANGSWDEAIDTLIALRGADPEFMTARVDGLLFLSLNQRGIEKIWQLGNLEGGIYDLALSERFGPLDVQANSARDLARLYIIGSSFWEVHPEQAVYYFGQVASAAPGLRDASGWTALERYRAALIQYGDLLASQGAWCDAQTQYELAMGVRADDQLAETLKAAMLKCSPPTNTPEPDQPSPTPTETIPPQFTATPTATGIIPPSPTATQTVLPPTETGIAPTPTETIPPQPPTSTQSVPPTPTETQVLPPTETFTPEPYPAGDS